MEIAARVKDSIRAIRRVEPVRARLAVEYRTLVY
jgi:hypothetical protein